MRKELYSFVFQVSVCVSPTRVSRPRGKKFPSPSILSLNWRVSYSRQPPSLDLDVSVDLLHCYYPRNSIVLVPQSATN